MQILLFDSAPMTFGGGFEYFVMGLARRAHERGHHVTIAGPHPAITAVLSVMSTGHLPHHVLSTEEVNTLTGGAEVIRTSRRGLRELGARADIVYCKNEPQELGLCGADEDKLIVGMHSATHRTEGRLAAVSNRLYGSGWYRNKLGDCLGIHAVAPRDDYDNPNVVVVPNGVDTKRFVPRERGAERFKVVFAGRLTPQKGIDLFCEAADHLSGSDIDFSVIGEGPMRPLVESALVSYSGYSSSPEDVFSAHDCVVVPSRWETFGLVPAEAMACGAVVLTSDIEGLAHYDPSVVVRFPADDVDALIGAIREAHRQWDQHREEFETRRRRSRELVMRDFSAEIRYGQLLDHFEATVNDTTTRRSDKRGISKVEYDN